MATRRKSFRVTNVSPKAEEGGCGLGDCAATPKPPKLSKPPTCQNSQLSSLHDSEALFENDGTLALCASLELCVLLAVSPSLIFMLRVVYHCGQDSLGQEPNQTSTTSWAKRQNSKNRTSSAKSVRYHKGQDHYTEKTFHTKNENPANPQFISIHYREKSAPSST